MAANAPTIPQKPSDAIGRYASAFSAPAGQVWSRVPILGRGGAFLYQWCDLQLAAAWFRFGRALLNEATLWRNALTFDPIADAGHVARLLNLAMQSLTTACNALNIQWHTLPNLRAVYREYFAGRPDGYPNEAAMRGPLFGKVLNYANDWWKGASNDGPRCVGLSENRGILARRAVELTRRYTNNPNATTILSLDFVPRVAPYARNEQESLAGLTDITAENLVNTLPQSLRWWPMGECKMLREPARNAAGYIDAWASCPALVQPPGTPSDDDFSFGWSRDRNGRVRWTGDLLEPTRVCYLPPDEFLPFCRAMFSAMDRETVSGTRMEQAVLNARTFVTQYNLDAMIANGGLDAWLNEVGNRDPDIRRAMTAPTPAVTASLLALDAVKPAITLAVSAAATPLGGAIAGLAIGAISTIVRFGDLLSIKAPTGVGRDDLGRYKPIFERGWLGGDPGQTESRSGAPAFNVPAAPEFVRATVPEFALNLVYPMEQRELVGTPTVLVDALGNTSVTDTPPAPTPAGEVLDLLVRAPATVTLTSDSLGTTTRETWGSAGAKYEQDGAYVRIYRFASDPGGLAVSVRKDEFCALNPGHPLCNALDPARRPAGARPSSSSSKATAFPVVPVALGVAGVLAAAYLFTRPAD